MSGSSSVVLSLLGTINSAYGGAGNTSLSMLQAIYGQSSSGAATANPLTALTQAVKNQTTEIARTEHEPEVARDIAAFGKAIAGATDAASLLKNRDFMKVLLTANGLGDQVPYAALAQKALLSDPADTSSLLAKLTNTAWKSTAQAYQFATKGLEIIQDPAVQTKLADAYAEVKWRQSLDKTTPGLSNALTFRAKASTVSDPYVVLGDPVLRDVVTTALGLPKEIALQSVETQARAITTRLDLTRFSDPHFVDSFTQRYLLAKQASATAATTPTLDSLAAQAGGLWV